MSKHHTTSPSSDSPTRNKKRPVVAIFTAPEGHLSIAQAIEAALADKFEVHTFFYHEPVIRAYRLMYQFFPGMLGISFELMKTSSAQLAFDSVLETLYARRIRDFYKKINPDVVISTYWPYNLALEKFSATNGAAFFNVITDPKTIHPLLISDKANSNIAFNSEAIKTCLAEKPDSKIDALGWFVRPEFTPTTDQAAVRSSLRLKANVFTILVVSGSEGTTHIMKILPALATSEKRVQVVVACGSNHSLLRGARLLRAFFKKMGSLTEIIPLGFTHKLNLYMQAADVIIGKAGPNSLFEATATHTPFFAITHISGQEDGNLDLIKSYKLGLVEENPLKAQKLLHTIISNPEPLKTLKSHIVKLASYNAQTGEKFARLIETTLQQKKTNST